MHRYHMLDDSNHISIPLLTEKNEGAPLLSAIEDLRANPKKAEQIGRAARHLVKEVLHPDNIDKYGLSYTCGTFYVGSTISQFLFLPE